MAKRKLPAALKAHQFGKGGVKPGKGKTHSKQTSMTSGSPMTSGAAGRAGAGKKRGGSRKARNGYNRSGY